MTRPQFQPEQAKAIASAFEAEQVDYLFKKDLLDLPLLERFQQEYERLHPAPLRSATDIARERAEGP